MDELDQDTIDKMDRLGIYKGNINKDLHFKLLRAFKSIEAFEYDGLIVQGNAVKIITKYCRLNPSKKFRTWLIDNYTIL